MIWNILGVIFVLYVIQSLARIKHQLNLITSQLNIKNEDEDIINSTDEEIEKELEDETK